MEILDRQIYIDKRSLKVLRSYGSGEFIDEKCRQECLKRGVLLHLVNLDSPFKKGIAERANRTVNDMITTMVIDAKLPHTLWEYAARHAVYVHSQVAVTRNI